MNRLAKYVLTAIKKRDSGKGEPEKFTTAADWSAEYLVSESEEEKKKLRSILTRTALIRDEVVFLITTFHNLDDRVIEILDGKKPKDPIGPQDIFEALHDKDWLEWIKEYFIAFRERKKQAKK